jgi:hypothetical protein
MLKSFIDMSRPHLLYTLGLGILMLLSLAGSNVPGLAFSEYLDFSLRRQLCAGLFLTGAVLGAWSLYRHVHRASFPWRVAQSQVSIPYLGFFILTFVAIFIAH